MMSDALLLAPYAVGLSLIWGVVAALRRRGERRVLTAESEARDAGLTEPASLHPVIDEALCIGCGACVTACPEGRILGLVDGRARIVEPTLCIGHGACAAACPVGGIELVFGTEKRGLDIPHIGSDFQTNVPGVYIAGELGGMGLIRSAVEQGRQAMAEIARARRPHDLPLDVIIVGAGPAGISASIAAKAAGLRYLTLEQENLGGTVSHFPRGKLVMTAPAKLPLVGTVRFREISKESLMAFWEDVVVEHDLDIRYETRVDAVEPTGEGFLVSSTGGDYQAAMVLLAIGRRGTPRRLGVPGEDLAKVVYRLVDPEQYRGQRVLVVGGGDSAIEAACTLAGEHGTQVALSYRGDAFARAKRKNRERIAALEADGRVEVLLGSTVTEIAPDRVRLGGAGKELERGNDAVIVCAGGILPTGFVTSIGVEVETKHGTR